MSSENSFYTPEEERVIIDHFKRAERTLDLWNAYHVLIKLAKEFNKISLPAIEEILDHRNSWISLLALPHENEEGFSCQDILTDENRSYTLFIFNRRQKKQKLMEIGSSTDLNKKHLAEAGMLKPLPGSLQAKQIRAPLN